MPNPATPKSYQVRHTKPCHGGRRLAAFTPSDYRGTGGAPCWLDVGRLADGGGAAEDPLGPARKVVVWTAYNCAYGRAYRLVSLRGI